MYNSVLFSIFSKLCNHYHYLIPDPKAGWKHIALIGSWILTWGNAWTSGRVGFTLKLLDWNLMWIFAVKKETHSSPKTTVINQKNLYLTKSCRTQGLSQRWLSLLSGLSLWPKLKILLFLPLRPAPLLRIFLTFFFFWPGKSQITGSWSQEPEFWFQTKFS